MINETPGRGQSLIMTIGHFDTRGLGVILAGIDI